MQPWIKDLFQNPEMLQMDHGQRLEDLSLGMGEVYYSLARLLRPKTVVVIGSWRGFAPIVFGKALIDNNENGQVLFIDPSMVDDFWKSPERVRQHFIDRGAPNVRHLLTTTQDFIKTPDYASLGNVGILMIDGFHTREQARFDYETFLPLLRKDGLVLFHDSNDNRTSTIYGDGRHYKITVNLFIDELRKDPALEILQFALAAGLTIVKRRAL